MTGVIETLILQAVARQGSRDTSAALSVLERAVALAAPEGYIRRFVDEGGPVAELLRALHRQSDVAGLRLYIEQLLAAFGPPLDLGARSKPPAPQPATALLDALNERELDILRLIADGRSNREIADTLVIAVSTVKTHINNCYSKLGVHSRTQGLARARELGLL